MLSPRDKMIPWYFVAFFVALALIDGVMVTIAVRTQTGVVTEHPYEKGLAYNRIVNAAEKQQSLGWKSDLNYAQGMLTFTLQDAAGKSIKPEKVIAAIRRPTQDGMDFSVQMNGGKAQVKFPKPGLWEVRMQAEVGNTQYQQIKRIVVQ